MAGPTRDTATGSRPPATGGDGSGSAGSCPTDPGAPDHRGGEDREHRPWVPGVTSRPAPVAIDDLALPRLSVEAGSIMAMMAEAADDLELAPEADSWPRRSGADRFGRLGEARLRRASGTSCALALRERGEPGRRPECVRQHALPVGLLRNRLLIENLIGRHPEIAGVRRSSAPIIICGLPRTGTTHLHNLMSAYPAFCP